MSGTTDDKIVSDFAHKHILSLSQFTPQSLERLFKTTEEIITRLEKGEILNTLAGKIVTLLFFEPSSRTFGSFSAAVKRLGGQTLEFQNPGQTSSSAKGETLEDSVRTFAQYSDAMVMRHPETGSIGRAAKVLPIPLLNAGDGGAGEHPTQALLDLFTIYKQFGNIDGLKILLAGDMFKQNYNNLLPQYQIE